MCGYCIESILLTNHEDRGDFIKQFRSAEMEYDVFIARGGSASEYILKEKDSWNSYPFMVHLCRLSEQCIRHNDLAIFSVLGDYFTENNIEQFYSEAARKNTDFWKPLLSLSCFRSKEAWSNFLLHEEMEKRCEMTIESYIRWWLLGDGRVTSEPEQRMKETGIMDPIDNTPPSEWEKFYGQFPVLFFALEYLCRYKAGSHLIIDVALTDVMQVPAFEGQDLRLQRRAFSHCVEEYGLEFIRSNPDKIRYELIYDVVLKGKVVNADLLVLREYIDTLHFGFMGMSSDDVNELIEDMCG